MLWAIIQALIIAFVIGGLARWACRGRIRCRSG
jgi:hypothetical protein